MSIEEIERRIRELAAWDAVGGMAIIVLTAWASASLLGAIVTYLLLKAPS